MKNVHLYFLLFVSSYSFACSDILNTEMRVLDSSDTVNLCEYEDQVVMIVNVASRCGYTYQYASLQSLYEKYKDEGFVVLASHREISFKNTQVKKMLLSFVQPSMELTFQCLLLLKFAVAKLVLCTKNLLPHQEKNRLGISINTLFQEMANKYISMAQK